MPYILSIGNTLIGARYLQFDKTHKIVQKWDIKIVNSRVRTESYMQNLNLNMNEEGSEKQPCQ